MAAERPDPSCPWPRRSAGRRWCIVQSEYHREATAAGELVRTGYLVYVPRFHKRIRDRSGRKWIEVQRPLFPSYLFTDVTDGVSFGWLAKVRGVRDLVRVGQDPAVVPDVLIRELQAREGGNFGQPYRRPGALAVKPGDEVRLADGGPFSGLLGRIEAVDARLRITVLIEFLGGLVPLTGLTSDQLDLA